MANYSYKVFSYDLMLSHNTLVTDGRTRTDDGHTDGRQSYHKLDGYLSTVG